MCILVIIASVIQPCKALLDSIVCQYADNNTYVLLAVYSGIVISLTRKEFENCNI